MNNRIPIDTYKSKSNESLMNSAPLNKSALKIKFFHNKLKQEINKKLWVY